MAETDLAWKEVPTLPRERAPRLLEGVEVAVAPPPLKERPTLGVPDTGPVAWAPRGVFRVLLTRLVMPVPRRGVLVGVVAVGACDWHRQSRSGEPARTGGDLG